jgi:hypothetical protein
VCEGPELNRFFHYHIRFESHASTAAFAAPCCCYIYPVPLHICRVVLLLLRQRRSVAGRSLGTTNKYLQRTTSGAAGNGLDTTAKYLRRTTGVALLANTSESKFILRRLILSGSGSKKMFSRTGLK